MVFEVWDLSGMELPRTADVVDKLTTTLTKPVAFLNCKLTITSGSIFFTCDINKILRYGQCSLRPEKIRSIVLYSPFFSCSHLSPKLRNYNTSAKIEHLNIKFKVIFCKIVWQHRKIRRFSIWFFADHRKWGVVASFLRKTPLLIRTAVFCACSATLDFSRDFQSFRKRRSFERRAR